MSWKILTTASHIAIDAFPYLEDAGNEASSIFAVFETIRNELVENEEKAGILTKPTYRPYSQHEFMNNILNLCMTEYVKQCTRQE
jgi:hypothetical protein